MSKMTKAYKCPQCGQEFTEKGRSFPFCSERCRLIDLGAWASEKYHIPASQSHSDESSSVLDEEDSFEHQRGDNDK